MANMNGTGVEIKILTMDSQTHRVRVDKSVPVPTLKEQIAQVTGVVPGHQRLLCRGRALKDDQNLSAYHVEDGHTLHLAVRQPVDPSPESSRNPPIIGSDVYGQADRDLSILINRLSDQVSMGQQFVDEEQGISDSSDRVRGELADNADGDLRTLINRLSDQVHMGREFVDEEQGISDSSDRVRGELADNADILRSIGEEGPVSTDAQRALTRVLVLRYGGEILNQQESDCLLQLSRIRSGHMILLNHLEAAMLDLARATVTVGTGQPHTPAVVQALAALSEEELLSESMDPSSQASGDQESGSSRPRREGDGPEAKRQRRG